MPGTRMETSVVGQPALRVAQAPFSCRLCDVELELRGVQTWRDHIKSEGHIYALQVKAAESGSIPSSPPSPSTNARRTPPPPRGQRTNEPINVDVMIDRDQFLDSHVDDDELFAPNFDPGNCLFCPQQSDMLCDNLSHMSSAHGFHVPFQDCLAVDLETAIRYLYSVVYGHRECICCGTRRGTVEGTRQHMVASGHCRFNISPDTEDLYELPRSRNTVMEQARRDASVPVRLPSGKLIHHRNNLETREARARRGLPDRRPGSSAAVHAEPLSAPGLEVANREGGSGSGSGQIVRSSEALLAAQLSRLGIADVRAQHKLEGRKRERLERANNSILFKHYRLDAGDGRFGRQF